MKSQAERYSSIVNALRNSPSANTEFNGPPSKRAKITSSNNDAFSNAHEQMINYSDQFPNNHSSRDSFSNKKSVQHQYIPFTNTSIPNNIKDYEFQENKTSIIEKPFPPSNYDAYSELNAFFGLPEDYNTSAVSSPDNQSSLNLPYLDDIYNSGKSNSINNFVSANVPNTQNTNAESYQYSQKNIDPFAQNTIRPKNEIETVSSSKLNEDTSYNFSFKELLEIPSSNSSSVEDFDDSEWPINKQTTSHDVRYMENNFHFQANNFDKNKESCVSQANFGQYLDNLDNIQISSDNEIISNNFMNQSNLDKPSTSQTTLNDDSNTLLKSNCELTFKNHILDFIKNHCSESTSTDQTVVPESILYKSNTSSLNKYNCSFHGVFGPKFSKSLNVIKSSINSELLETGSTGCDCLSDVHIQNILKNKNYERMNESLNTNKIQEHRFETSRFVKLSAICSLYYT